ISWLWLWSQSSDFYKTKSQIRKFPISDCIFIQARSKSDLVFKLQPKNFPFQPLVMQRFTIHNFRKKAEIFKQEKGQMMCFFRIQPKEEWANNAFIHRIIEWYKFTFLNGNFCFPWISNNDFQIGIKISIFAHLINILWQNRKMLSKKWCLTQKNTVLSFQVPKFMMAFLLFMITDKMVQN